MLFVLNDTGTEDERLFDVPFKFITSCRLNKRYATYVYCGSWVTTSCILVSAVVRMRVLRYFKTLVGVCRIMWRR